MNTPSESTLTPQPILPGAKVPFPCWLWSSRMNDYGFPQWICHRSDGLASYDGPCHFYTHYLVAPIDADPATFPRPGERMPIQIANDGLRASYGISEELAHKLIMVGINSEDAMEGVLWRDLIDIGLSEADADTVMNAVAKLEASRPKPAVLPSLASAPKYPEHVGKSGIIWTGAFVEETLREASAEAGDWADAAAHKIAHTVWHLDADEKQSIFASIIRLHAPQSQSKAEAVGAELHGAISVYGKANQLFGGALSRDESEALYPMVVRAYAALLKALAAQPPSTQNPPENAKGEGWIPVEVRRPTAKDANSEGNVWWWDSRYSVPQDDCWDAGYHASHWTPKPFVAPEPPQSTPSTREEGRT